MHLHRDVLAPAERAANAAQVQAHALRRQVEAGAELLLVDVQPLRRDVEVDAALAVGHREAGLGAEEGLVLHAHLVLAADDDLGLRVRVAEADAARGAAGCRQDAARARCRRARPRGP